MSALTLKLVRPWAFFLISTVFCLVLSSCGSGDSTGETKSLSQTLCPTGAAVETEGHKRLALVVGVGDYKNQKVPDLIGAPQDAKRFYDLLTGENGYGFPKENVCLLLNEKATTAQFKEMFNKALVDSADENDVVIVYFAGHGSQTKDRNGDEPDEYDETFLFQDARTGGIRDLTDDELNQMLARLHTKTKNVTVILDSCNSGSATRGDADTTIARFAQPIDEELTVDLEGGDNGAGWMSESMPGLIVLTAATDGTSAIEKGGRGVFTDALIQVLSAVGPAPLTYAQVARQVPPLVAAHSYQVPFFHGDLNKTVFGVDSRRVPRAWEVRAVEPVLELSGPPLPGIGIGAELRVYDGAITGADTRDPAKAKATVVLDEVTGVNAHAHVLAAAPNATKIVEGDLAVMVRPSDDMLKIKVRLRPVSEPGGIPQERAEAITAAVRKDEEARGLIEFITGNGEYELSLGSDGKAVLRGPENKIRNVYQSDAAVAENLWQHARQGALLHLRGEGASRYVDQETLRVQLVPARKQSACADGVWQQATPNQEQIIPLCHAYNVQVTLSDESPTGLLVGGVIASSDGSTFGFSADGRRELLHPGETVTFDSRRETFLGTLPLDTLDNVLVFGTQETNPVRWDLLTQTAETRAAGPKMTGLYRALDRYLRPPGTRGQTIADDDVEDTAWTMSSLRMRVEANSRFLKADDAGAQAIQSRDYTIKNFDIRPYLPDDENTAIYKVLQKADWLAKASADGGFSYKQHAWSKPTDEENLAVGIDGSRSLWFAFTRAGLKYNRDDRYLHTAIMVGDSLMTDEFERCDNDALQMGDILVYRDKKRGDGHVVMVIDAAKRIAWGSHGWDGNARVLPVEPDTGVEYQLIKYEKDWERWDRKTVYRRACWRYRAFNEEKTRGRGLPGVKALSKDVCSAKKQCGLGDLSKGSG